ncbi:hypothetical protein GCM10010218_03000 [Streptomyces mashuensis]|uniref:DUF5709 domain-containing protein n=1 Tax=Streptomyces mashuensis TaxID=33904 RepID=A0A919E8P3_9ACTN|nr:DUF5709 domain-containing protein [Streptomyces mashuensis]GHF25711.1 hypothetical protein GCM10010218_03000 [Streptomyces mashuensis]
MSDDAMGDEVYQPVGGPDAQDNPELDLENALGEDALDEVLDRGWSPPERPLAVDHTGTTAREQHDGETLDQRLAEEVPDVTAPDGDGIGDLPGGNGEPVDEETGDARAGRLVASDDWMPHRRNSVAARDVGIDGAGASAEEAAMHVIPEEPPVEPLEEE